MPFPIKVCAVCGEEFELKPDKPGFANRCPACSEPDDSDSGAKSSSAAPSPKPERALEAERKRAIRDLLYRKDS